MPSPIKMRNDYSAPQLRVLAKNAGISAASAAAALAMSSATSALSCASILPDVRPRQGRMVLDLCHF